MVTAWEFIGRGLWISLVLLVGTALVAGLIDLTHHSHWCPQCRWLVGGVRAVEAAARHGPSLLLMRMFFQILPSLFEVVIWVSRATSRAASAEGQLISTVANALSGLMTIVRIASAKRKTLEALSFLTVVDALCIGSQIVTLIDSCWWPQGAAPFSSEGARCQDSPTGLVARTWFTFAFLRALYVREIFWVIEQLLLGGVTLEEFDRRGVREDRAAAGEVEPGAPEADLIRVADVLHSQLKQQEKRKSPPTTSGLSRPSTDLRTAVSDVSGTEAKPAPAVRTELDAISLVGSSKSSSDPLEQRSSGWKATRRDRLVLTYGIGWQARAVRLLRSVAWLAMSIIVRAFSIAFIVSCLLYSLERLGDPPGMKSRSPGLFFLYGCDDGSVSPTPTVHCVEEVFSPFSAFYFLIVTTATVGYGDFAPTTALSRMVIIVVIVTGLAFFANTTTLFLRMLEEERKQPKSVRQKLERLALPRAHILVVGNPTRTQLKVFLQEFFHPDHVPVSDRLVVFLMPSPSPDIVDLLRDDSRPWSSRVELIIGSPSNDVDLYRAAADEAAAILLLPARGVIDGQQQDRRNLLEVRDIGILCYSCRMCAQKLRVGRCCESSDTWLETWRVVTQTERVLPATSSVDGWAC